MSEKKSEGIYLNDGSIRDWDRPLKPGFIRMPSLYEASTKPIEVVGVDSMDETVGEYRVVATATKFRAMIQRINRDKIWEPNPNSLQEEVLFSGGITILKDEVQIPGTELAGFDVKKVGEIWTASADIASMAQSGSLRTIVLGDKSSEYSARITAIVLGFEEQEEARQRAQDSARSSAFSSGQESTRREPLRRFPRD